MLPTQSSPGQVKNVTAKLVSSKMNLGVTVKMVMLRLLVVIVYLILIVQKYVQPMKNTSIANLPVLVLVKIGLPSTISALNHVNLGVRASLIM